MADNPIPRPRPIEELECDTTKHYNSEDSCYPLEKKTDPHWRISEVFGRPIYGDCPIGSAANDQDMTVCLRAPRSRPVQVYVSDDRYTQLANRKFADDTVTCIRPPPNGTEFGVGLDEMEVTDPLALTPPRLHAFRSITGYGQERGGIQSVLTNPSATEDLEVVYLDTLPWYMKPYIHTLRATVSPKQEGGADPIQETYYRPALD